MTLKRVTREQSIKIRDSVETELLALVNREFKQFLNDLKAQARQAVFSASPNVLLASGSDEMPTLGEVATMWTQHVDGAIVEGVREAYNRVLHRWTDDGEISIESPQMEASRDYIAQVRDRLVRGTHLGTTVYDESFDKIRTALAQSAAEGWSRDQLAARIAAELGWEKNGSYWRSTLSTADGKIDDILDALGPPGSTAREHARLHDPRVKALRADRNLAIKHLDAEKSVWRNRATLIARTESTGAANFGALQAMTMEGVATKVWEATADTRTRPTHSAASGQEVSINKKFNVGGSLLAFPGDPRGPVTEVANCRCTMVQGDL